MVLYTIEPTAGTVHGSFSRELPPVLTIDPGDTVRYRPLDAGWNVARSVGPHPCQRQTFPQRDPEQDSGYALCAPIAIRGAKPGMTLAVHIDAIEPADWGWNVGNDWWAIRNEPNADDPVEIFLLGNRQNRQQGVQSPRASHRRKTVSWG